MSKWTEKAREFLKSSGWPTLNHSREIDKQWSMIQTDGLMASFASEVERLTLERAAKKQLIAIEYLINQEVAFHEQKQHHSVDFKAGFMLGLKQVRDHLLPIAKEESVAVASSQGGE